MVRDSAMRPLPPWLCRLLLISLFSTLGAGDGLCVALEGNVPLLVEKASPRDFLLSDAGKTAPLVLEPALDKQVRRAALDLATDLERVTGVRAEILSSGQITLPAHCVLVGVVGQSALLDKVAASGAARFDELKGLWESFEIRVVENPLPGVERALIVAGSDRRGAIYGLYEISEAIGVSPWYWWADVPSKRRSQLAIAAGPHRVGPPSVKYRGIFLNDEDWGLQKWAAKTHEPELGDIGPKTYARIFELLLRLRANTIWPAMHHCTQAFNNYPQNRVVADEYGIVMGSSHCEPLLRNNVTEWKGTDEEFDFTKNGEAIRNYWDQRLVENGRYENLYTLGIRGIHDSAMRGPKTPAERVQWLEKVFDTQRELLAARVSPDVASIPQIFCPYKEVLSDFKNGLRVPPYATVVVPDDNFGYLRYLPSEEERARQTGGFGAYYHISYLGRPLSYLWLNTTPPALLWEEMSKAYEHGVTQFWMLNVGDLKPGEIGIQFFLEMAWDADRWRHDTLSRFPEVWAARTFGPAHAAEIASVLSRYYQLAFARKPEHLQWNLPGEPLRQSAFTAWDYGDEIQKRLEAYARLKEDAEKLSETLPEECRDAFYELVAYPAIGSALANQRYFYSEKARLYAAQGRAHATQRAAEQAQQADAQLSAATAFYNLKVADGKWRGILSLEPADEQWKSMRISRWEAPPPQVFPEQAALGVAPEGCATVPSEKENPTLPEFEAPDDIRFVDVFNRGTQPASWSARVSAPWIRLSKSEGALRDDRLLVSIDPSLRPQGRASGNIEISAAGGKTLVAVSLAPLAQTTGEKTRFVQKGGVVSIEAGHFDASVERAGVRWSSVQGLGRTGAAVTPLPSSASSVELAHAPQQAPYLEYAFTVRKGGRATLRLDLLPTFSVRYGKNLRLAFGLDDEAPKMLEASNEAGTKQWSEAVLDSCLRVAADLGQVAEGRHTLRIYMVDPGVVLDKLLVDFGGLRPSCLGAPETTVP